ncbi:hypothetical protein FKM82_020540 [Ascaphus truei]
MRTKSTQASPVLHHHSTVSIRWMSDKSNYPLNTLCMVIFTDCCVIVLIFSIPIYSQHRKGHLQCVERSPGAFESFVTGQK